MTCLMGPWVKRLSLIWQRLNRVLPASDHCLGKYGNGSENWARDTRWGICGAQTSSDTVPAPFSAQLHFQRSTVTQCPRKTANYADWA